MMLGRKKFNLKVKKNRWDKTSRGTRNRYSEINKKTRNLAVRANKKFERNTKLNVIGIENINIEFKNNKAMSFDAYHIDYQAKNPMTEKDANMLVGIKSNGDVYAKKKDLDVNEVYRLIKFLFKKIHFVQLKDNKSVIIPIDDWTWRQIKEGKEIKLDEYGRYIDVIGEKPTSYTDIIAQKAIKLIPYGWPYGYTDTMLKEAKVYKKGDETRIYEPYNIRESFEDDRPETIKRLVRCFEEKVKENKGKEVLMGAVITLADHEHAIPLSIKYKNGKIRVIAFNTNGSKRSLKNYAEPICNAINKMWSDDFFNAIGGNNNIEYCHCNFSEQKDGTCLTTSELEVQAMMKGQKIGDATDDLTTWYTAFTNAAHAHLCEELSVERRNGYTKRKNINNVRSSDNARKYHQRKRVNFLPK